MLYNLDSSFISLSDYIEILKRQDLLPSRRQLSHNIDQNFDSIRQQGITNIAQLQKRLSTSQEVSSFAACTGIQEEYLIILKREIGSLTQKPVPLESFLDADSAKLQELKAKGIKTSKDYYESGSSGSDELFCLCDLVRINGVGAVAARAFFEAGYLSVADVAQADAAEMLGKVSNINDEKKYYKIKLGVKDMQFCIDFAKLLLKYSG
ncbi:MAG: DUF4332 domain-containing protein [Acidobacteria bacterium]|nr:DUF4332 domain-containing protein [Acidobacteriota bacterium]